MELSKWDVPRETGEFLKKVKGKIIWAGYTASMSNPFELSVRLANHVNDHIMGGEKLYSFPVTKKLHKDEMFITWLVDNYFFKVYKEYIGEKYIWRIE